jgi:DNA repair photolyase
MTSLFPDTDSRALPVLGDQGDIRYLGAAAQGVLNPPEATGMDYWSINPYVGCAFGCAYCYARYAHRYLMERSAARGHLDDALGTELESMPPWLAFERRIVVKTEAPALVRRALRRPAPRRAPLLAGEEGVVVGTATDPYQPAERRFRVTRGVLEALAEHAGLRVVIITKSPLVTRDVDVLARLTGRGSRVTVCMSLITLDRDLARRIEPRAPTPEARLRAIARLSEAGIDVGVNVMPVLPGITDAPEALAALVGRVAAAGASHLNACALRLQSTARARYLPFIRAEFPALAERYESTYARGHQAGERYREGLSRFMREACGRAGLRYGHRDEDEGVEESEQPVLGTRRSALGERHGIDLATEISRHDGPAAEGRAHPPAFGGHPAEGPTSPQLALSL